MNQPEQRPGETSQATGSDKSRMQALWDVSQTVLGVVLFVAVAALLALYFVGPHFLADKTKLLSKLSVASKENSAGVFLILVTLGTMALLFVQRERQGVRAVLGLVMAGLAVVGLAGSMLPEKTLWGWVFAALPAMLVVHHGLYLGLIKPRVISLEMIEGTAVGAMSSANFKDMVDSHDRYFTASNIALRYGLPALAIFTIGMIIFHGLTPMTPWSLDTLLLEKPGTGPQKEWITYSTMEAARLGAAGAYVYVLLYLGQRGFRHDITSGAALWCAVTLALGPLLAAAVSKIWVAGTGSPAGASGWGTQALYFGIGMSPRHVAQAVARQALRMVSDPAKFVPPERTVALSMIRGIIPQIEERLGEEGIHDVVGLAMADPLRLQRSTNFDKHQILGWIDAALLAHALPEGWQNLEKKGVRGARDLIWYVSGPDADKAEGLKKLATDELDELVLRNVAQRLSQDAQAQRILLLYQLMAEAESPPMNKGPSDVSGSVAERLAADLQKLPPAADTTGTATPEAAPKPQSEEPKAPPPPEAQG
jgi:hypothetical protein